MKPHKGFTLIELLVVISIISLLSSVVLSSLNSARVKARDTRRIQDLEQIKLALELYYSDKGYYPPSACGWDCNNYRYSYSASSWNALASELAPYIQPLPTDPFNSLCTPWGTDCYSYAYGNVGRDSWRVGYDLVAQFEQDDHPLRCELKQYKFNYSGASWCGNYSDQMYADGGLN